MRVEEGGIENPILLNDSLTPHNWRLIWMTKTRVKKYKWKFVRNGCIYARKNEHFRFILSFIFAPKSEINKYNVSNLDYIEYSDTV